jgi:hypothetical protein
MLCEPCWACCCCRCQDCCNSCCRQLGCCCCCWGHLQGRWVECLLVAVWGCCCCRCCCCREEKLVWWGRLVRAMMHETLQQQRPNTHLYQLDFATQLYASSANEKLSLTPRLQHAPPSTLFSLLTCATVSFWHLDAACRWQFHSNAGTQCVCRPRMSGFSLTWSATTPAGWWRRRSQAVKHLNNTPLRRLRRHTCNTHIAAPLHAVTYVAYHWIRCVRSADL